MLPLGLVMGCCYSWDITIKIAAVLIDATFIIVVCSSENAFDVVESIANDSMESSEDCKSHFEQRTNNQPKDVNGSSTSQLLRMCIQSPAVHISFTLTEN
jgi:hypothetical protein